MEPHPVPGTVGLADAPLIFRLASLSSIAAMLRPPDAIARTASGPLVVGAASSEETAILDLISRVSSNSGRPGTRARARARARCLAPSCPPLCLSSPFLFPLSLFLSCFFS